jgi:hypothetical protein
VIAEMLVINIEGAAGETGLVEDAELERFLSCPKEGEGNG